MQQIPLSLMPDSMTVAEPVDGDYGGEYSENTYTIPNVRFDAAAPLLRLGYVLEDGSKGLVYVDSSVPNAKEIPVGSLVTIRGERMSVVKNSRYEDFDGHVHHWELEVR